MSGMFWHNNYAQSVQIDLLLSEKDITLTTLMDAEDVLQECKSQNKKLIEYLTRSDILEELVNLIIEEPSQDLDESRRYKYSNVACELLTSDVPILIEKLAGNEMLLSKLYSFIDKDQALNPLLASFFSKTLHALLRRATDQNWISHQFVCLQVLESLKSRKNYVDLLLNHIQTSAIMDLLLILLTKIEGDEMHQNILNWLEDQHLVQRLIKLLSPSSDPERHTNASQLLCDIIKSPIVESEKRPDLILQSLQSEETVNLILKTILTEVKLESSIVGGVRILINLLGQKEIKNTESSENYGVPFSNIVEDKQRIKIASIIVKYLDKFNELLLYPPEKPSVKTTAGHLEKPFGRSRLYILKLYVRILTTDSTKILEQFLELHTFNILLDLFFHFTWNNFLHTQVQQCFSLTLNCDSLEKYEFVYSHVLIKSKLIDRILDVWTRTAIEQGGIRKGYLGHLIIMANEIVKKCEDNNIFSNFLKANLSETTMQKWLSFTMSELDEINKKQQLILGEPPEAFVVSSSGNSDESFSYLQDSYGQEFLNGQKQLPAPVYINTVNDFQMENQKDEYESLQQRVDESKEEDDEFVETQELFDRICEEKQFSDVNNDERWGQIEDIQIETSSWINPKRVKNSLKDEGNADHPHELPMNEKSVDSFNFIKTMAESNSSSVSLWEANAPTAVEQIGWANFDNISDVFHTNISYQQKTYKTIDTRMSEGSASSDNMLDPKNITFDLPRSIDIAEIINETNNIQRNAKVENVFHMSNFLDSERSDKRSDSYTNNTILQKQISECKDMIENSEENTSTVSKECIDN